MTFRKHILLRPALFWKTVELKLYSSVLRPVHKRRPQSGGEGLRSTDILRTRGVLQMRMRALFGATNNGFFVMVCPHGQDEELIQCGHFSDKGEGVKFDFVRTSFMNAS